MTDETAPSPSSPVPPKSAAVVGSDPSDAQPASAGSSAAPAGSSAAPAGSSTDANSLVENEPYLGPAWAVAMLILYLLKEAFPAEEYSFYWWFQIYIVGIVVVVTLFTLVKRHQFYELHSDDEAFADEVSPSTKALLSDPGYIEAGNRDSNLREASNRDSVPAKPEA